MAYVSKQKTKKKKQNKKREREREREKGFTLAKSSPRSKNFIECIILNWHVFKMYIKIM
jgi:predicted amidophosphoribosyltransferase